MSLEARDGDDGALAEAVGRYALGELSLGAAANRAGITRWEMADLLDEAGVPVRLGPETEEALAEEIEAARDLE